MPDLPPGLYDELVTLALQRRLDDPDLQVERAPLSADTSSEALARHIFRFASAVLSSVKGREPEKIARQIALTNQLLDGLAGLDGTVDPEDRVTAERHAL